MKRKQVTSQDVARKAGVSRTTVSLILNRVAGAQFSPETERRVFTAAEELGYVPNAAAQALVSRRSGLVGLVLARRLPSIAADIFLTALLEGLIETLADQGLRLLIDVVEDPTDPLAYLRLVRSSHVDGLLFSGAHASDLALPRLAAEGFPAVLIGTQAGLELPSVDIDNRAAAALATNHLLRLGHTQIACITNAGPEFAGARDRLAGYRDAVEEHGLPFRPAQVRYGDFTTPSGFNAMQSLLDDRIAFTAAFIAGDQLAIGALAALHRAGRRVPEDTALVGFDDSPSAPFTDPPLTTIHVPAAGLAQAAGLMLLRTMRGETLPSSRVVLDTELVVRASSGGSILAP